MHLRRTIHQNPELAYEERETARLVADTLAPLGFELRTGVAKTGIVATLEGAHPGPTLLFDAHTDTVGIAPDQVVPVLAARTLSTWVSGRS